jgi:hypothetical protein
MQMKIHTNLNANKKVEKAIFTIFTKEMIPIYEIEEKTPQQHFEGNTKLHKKREFPESNHNS